jgi:hypothetical protein
MRIIVQAGLGKKQDPISKIIRTKRAGGMAQVVECLISKHETEFKFQYHKKKKKSKSLFQKILSVTWIALIYLFLKDPETLSKEVIYWEAGEGGLVPARGWSWRGKGDKYSAKNVYTCM